jgi:glycosyltransferase involved in cell wall biosynthesis
MKPAIDAHMLGGTEGGNESYIWGLLRGLSDAPELPISEIAAIVRKNYIPPKAASPNLLYRRLGWGGNLSRLLWGLTRIAAQERADILHTTYICPPLSSIPVALSVHDVGFRRYPGSFSPRDRLLFSTLLPLSMRRAGVVLALSKHGKREIERFYPFCQGKVRVVEPAPGPIVEVEPDFEAGRRISARSEYILAVSSLQPRKNISRIIRAFVAARRAGIRPVRLIVAGRAQWNASPIVRLARESPFSDDITFTGYLNDATLAALIRECQVFLYLSLYEGFGLPIIEAMKMGAPVVASNREPMKSIASDAARLVEPEDVGAINEAIVDILGNESLRDAMVSKGHLRVEDYSWRRTAHQAYRAYALATNARSTG